MLYPTAGSRLFIADAPTSWHGAISGAWVQISEVEAMGRLGIEWSTEEAEHASCDGDIATHIVMAKRTLRIPPMQVIMANDPTDPGQSILWNAARSQSLYPFRLVFPGGEQSREWLALVRLLTEVFDAANSVMKLEAELIPSTGGMS